MSPWSGFFASTPRGPGVQLSALMRGRAFGADARACRELGPPRRACVQAASRDLEGTLTNSSWTAHERIPQAFLGFPLSRNDAARRRGEPAGARGHMGAHAPPPHGKGHATMKNLNARLL